MVIVELESTPGNSWLDPVIDIHLTQFAEDIKHLERMCEADVNVSDVTQVAERLCDSSRQILFRMRRVTSKQLKDVASIFREAVAVINSPNVRKVSAGTPIEEYGKHIDSRVKLLIDFCR